MTPLFLALMLQTAPAPACSAAVAPPAGLKAWGAIMGVTMGPIAIGKGAGLALQPVEKVTFTPAPDRAPKPGTFGGAYPFTVATAGTYRVALSSGAWIDVVRNGKSLKSVAHMEGPACSGIRKIVDFTLSPGRYTLQLSNAQKMPMRVLIVPK